jgi:methyl halide transferase
MEHSLIFDKDYWQNRYSNRQTGWDTGEITTPLKEYFDQLMDKNIRILIPGAGNAYEAEYLHQSGFTSVTVLDIAPAPLAALKQRAPMFPEDNLVCGDFFKHDKKYDLVVEQTFFCALHPDERSAYAKKVAELLVPGGKLVGVLFNREFEGGPPFGGSEQEYRKYFEPLFNFKTYAACYNSIKPRLGSEWFINLVKR